MCGDESIEHLRIVMHHCHIRSIGFTNVARHMFILHSFHNHRCCQNKCIVLPFVSDNYVQYDSVPGDMRPVIQVGPLVVPTALVR